MFCFQNEQTAKCSGCSDTMGVHGKRSVSAELRDKLTGSLIGLARATDGNEHLISSSSTEVIVESLYATVTNVCFDSAALQKLLDRVREGKRKMVPDCFACASPCGKNNDYDMEKLWATDEDIRSLKSVILLGIRGMAAHASHAAALGYHDETVDRFFYKALIVIGMDDFPKERLMSIVQEMGQINLKCMELLDKAGGEADLAELPGNN